VSRLRLCLLVLPALLLAPPARADPPPLPNPRPVIPEVRSTTVATDHAYAGDRPMLATVTPNGDGYRDLVRIRFYVTAPAQVTIRAQAAQRNFQRIAQPAWSLRRKVKRGWQEVTWRPAAGLEPTTYVTLITLAWGRNVLQYGRLARDSTNPQSPIVRVLASDAMLDKRSYVPGDTAQLTIANDATALNVHVLDVAATETQPTANHVDAPDLVPPLRVEWATHRDAPATVPLAIGDWKPGVYFVAVVSDAGDVGYVPLIVRASKPTDRVAVLIPDHTWYAYDFFDDNRDGFPDSWYYRQGNDVVSLARPFAHSGMPWQFNSQMWPFLRWARLHDAPADFLSESDAIARRDRLAEDYDLIVVPTHLEYVSEAEYDALQRYRDAGGDLIFLASNDLYWKVEIDGTSMRRVQKWRDAGRPESALVGAQYAGSKTNDAGPYVVAATAAGAWAFAGMGLAPDGLFSSAGDEFDLTTQFSPPGTQVLATVRTPYHRGEMTYYEVAGAKVFAPGAFLTERVLQPPESRLLENLWNNSDAPDLPAG
jgi:hypothetical protein